MEPINALILNCTLKPSPQPSNTQALLDKAVAEFGRLGVTTEVVRVVDYDVKPGTSSDEGDGDQWPLIFEKVRRCDILVLAAPIWVGRLASTGQR